jgi:hypothetical protein
MATKIKAKHLCAASLVALGVGAASSAPALTVFGAGSYPTEQVVYSAGTNTPAGLVPSPFTAYSGPIGLSLSSAHTVDEYVFNLDWNHLIPVYVGSQFTGSGSTPNGTVTFPITYNQGTLTTDNTAINTSPPGPTVTSPGGNALSLDKSKQIQTLINQGVACANAGASCVPVHPVQDADNVSDTLAAYQAAIYKIEYDINAAPYDPTTGFNFTNVVSDLVSYAVAHPASGAAATLFDPNGVSATLGEAMAIPEPSTWAMMLLGLGGVGGMMRSRRKLATA